MNKREDNPFRDRYKIFSLDEDSKKICFYCGMPSQVLDHVPPLSEVESLSFIHRISEFYLVPSCSECNSLAGSEPHINPFERLVYVVKMIEKKYKNQLTIPEWSQSEIDSLGHRLKHSVEENLAIKRITRKRLLHSETLLMIVANSSDICDIQKAYSSSKDTFDSDLTNNYSSHVKSYIYETEYKLKSSPVRFIIHKRTKNTKRGELRAETNNSYYGRFRFCIDDDHAYSSYPLSIFIGNRKSGKHLGAITTEGILKVTKAYEDLSKGHKKAITHALEEVFKSEFHEPIKIHNEYVDSIDLKLNCTKFYESLKKININNGRGKPFFFKLTHQTNSHTVKISIKKTKGSYDGYLVVSMDISRDAIHNHVYQDRYSSHAGRLYPDGIFYKSDGFKYVLVRTTRNKLIKELKRIFSSDNPFEYLTDNRKTLL